jgi:HD superfamily phosphohydrolase YqeK
VTLVSGYQFYFEANLAEASSPIFYVDEEGSEVGTQYQTADARHRMWRAAELMHDLYAESDEDEIDEIFDVEEEEDEEEEEEE